MSDEPDDFWAGTLPPQQPDIIPMNLLGEQIAARFKETFFSYNNRRAADNRSAQTTLGPSEIGTECDRRLAMTLMGLPAVNPGGDAWASFVGTQIHRGAADMFEWANAGTGRYASEMPLTLPSALVPHGTGDLLDRTLCVFEDFKAMGSWSRNKLKTEGPSATYRVQLHTYGYGATLRGEKVEYVAIVALPRDESSLDDLYVWVEPYDPKVAIDALARVDDIAAKVEALETERATWAGLDINAHHLAIAAEFGTADACRYCPFHKPGARSLLADGGCPGPTS
ncbi:hypothetical protein [Streptomyces sp. NPDC055085]